MFFGYTCTQFPLTDSAFGTVQLMFFGYTCTQFPLTDSAFGTVQLIFGWLYTLLTELY